MIILGTQRGNIQCISKDCYKPFYRDGFQQGCVYWKNSPSDSDMFH